MGQNHPDQSLSLEPPSLWIKTSSLIVSIFLRSEKLPISSPHQCNGTQATECWLWIMPNTPMNVSNILPILCRDRSQDVLSEERRWIRLIELGVHREYGYRPTFHLQHPQSWFCTELGNRILRLRWSAMSNFKDKLSPLDTMSDVVRQLFETSNFSRVLTKFRRLVADPSRLDKGRYIRKTLSEALR